MATKEDFKEQKEKEFLQFLCELQEYLKQNPNHKGTISKVENQLGRKLYTFYEIRTGKRPHSFFGEQHFSVIDKILPDWDSYSMSRFDFDKFCTELEKFTTVKNAHYDKFDVPEVLRDLHVPNDYKIGKYDLGTRVYRVKSGTITLTQNQLDIINSINPHCLEKVPTYDIPGFYIALKHYVAEKDKEYDKLGIPAEMRDYSVNRNSVVGDFKIGGRLRHFKDNWKNLTKAQQECFLKLSPSLFDKKKSNSFNFAKFFMEYLTFINNKNKYYDQIETPEELRDYTIHRNEYINGESLGDKLYYVKKHYHLTAKEEEALNKLNPKWRDKATTFDFGEFYGQLIQFRKQRDAYYDQRNVPQEKRAYTVFSSSYINNYQLGINMYLIKTGRIKISKTEKEYLLSLDPNCLSSAIKAPTINRMQKAEEERVQI